MRRQPNTTVLLREYNPTCSHSDCHEHPFMIVDESAPLRWHKEVGTEKEKDDIRLTSSVSRGLLKHPTGLCYFHLKKREGFFDRHYPLKTKMDISLGVRSLVQKTGLSALFKN